MRITPNFLLDFNNTCQDRLFPHIQKPRKDTFKFVGIFLEKTELFGPSRDAQNVCAVAKGGTNLKSSRLIVGFQYALTRIIARKLVLSIARACFIFKVSRQFHIQSIALDICYKTIDSHVSCAFIEI